MDESQEPIHARLRRYRQNNHLSQEEVAKKLDVTRQAVTKWETGASLPSTANLLALSRLYHVSVTELTDGTKTQIEEQSEDITNDESSSEKVFWTIEKEAFFVFCTGLFFALIYFIARTCGAYPSMTLFLSLQIPIFVISTVITCITDSRIHTKSGLLDIALPLLFVIGIQIMIGLIIEL